MLTEKFAQKFVYMIKEREKKSEIEMTLVGNSIVIWAKKFSIPHDSLIRVSAQVLFISTFQKRIGIEFLLLTPVIGIGKRILTSAGIWI